VVAEAGGEEAHFAAVHATAGAAMVPQGQGVAEGTCRHIRAAPIAHWGSKNQLFGNRESLALNPSECACLLEFDNKSEEGEAEYVSVPGPFCVS